MHAFVADRKERIQHLCEVYTVESLHLFGSALSDEFDPETSDLDFLVDFPPMEPGDLAGSYLGLLEDLERLFARHVDLVVYRAIENPYFRKSVDEHRVMVYAAA